MDHHSPAVSNLVVRDYREVPVDELPQRLELEWRNCRAGLLSTARRPRKRWTETLNFARPLILSSAPQFELILWVPQEATLDLEPAVRQEQAFLLDAYRDLFESPNAPLLERYQKTLQSHITHQETSLFPRLEALAPIERATRELGYEHQGLKKGLERLPKLVEQSHRGELEARQRERFDLDFYHLLEHHIERERDALYPAQAYLQAIS